MFDILEEERKRLINLRQRYADELEELPKGSLSYKKRWNKEYVYLAYRKSGTVKFDYVGRADSHAVRALSDKVKTRSDLREKLRRVDENIAEIDKAW